MSLGLNLAGVRAEARRYLEEAERLNRQGAVHHVNGETAIAEILFGRALKAFGKGLRIQAIRDEEERRGMGARLAAAGRLAGGGAPASGGVFHVEQPSGGPPSGSAGAGPA